MKNEINLFLFLFFLLYYLLDARKQDQTAGIEMEMEGVVVGVMIHLLIR